MVIKFRVVCLWYNFRQEITRTQATKMESVSTGDIDMQNLISLCVPVEFDKYEDAEKWIKVEGKKDTVYDIDKVFIKN